METSQIEVDADRHTFVAPTRQKKRRNAQHKHKTKRNRTKQNKTKQNKTKPANSRQHQHQPTTGATKHQQQPTRHQRASTQAPTQPNTNTTTPPPPSPLPAPPPPTRAIPRIGQFAKIKSDDGWAISMSTSLVDRWGPSHHQLHRQQRISPVGSTRIHTGNNASHIFSEPTHIDFIRRHVLHPIAHDPPAAPAPAPTTASSVRYSGRSRVPRENGICTQVV